MNENESIQKESRQDDDPRDDDARKEEAGQSENSEEFGKWIEQQMKEKVHEEL